MTLSCATLWNPARRQLPSHSTILHEKSRRSTLSSRLMYYSCTSERAVFVARRSRSRERRRAGRQVKLARSRTRTRTINLAIATLGPSFFPSFLRNYPTTTTTTRNRLAGRSKEKDNGGDVSLPLFLSLSLSLSHSSRRRHDRRHEKRESLSPLVTASRHRLRAFARAPRRAAPPVTRCWRTAPRIRRRR